MTNNEKQPREATTGKSDNLGREQPELEPRRAGLPRFDLPTTVGFGKIAGNAIREIGKMGVRAWIDKELESPTVNDGAWADLVVAMDRDYRRIREGRG